MKESITINNLGPLRDVRIDDIRPFTVLVGESGSGKSLLMKTIIMMRYIYKRLNIRGFLSNSGIKRSFFRIRIESLLHEELKFFFAKEDVSVSYTVEFEAGHSYTIDYSNKKLTLPRNIAAADLVFTKESWISETRNVIPAWRANTTNGRGWLGFYFYETMKDFDEAISAVSDYDMDFVRGRISVVRNNGVSRPMLAIEGRHPKIELRYASSGMQTAAPLVVLTQYFSRYFSFKEAKRRSVLSYLFDSDKITQFHPQIELSDIKTMVNLHIEEPELSLDPEAQIRLIMSIVDMSFRPGGNTMTLMLATHSPYIVNALNLILNEPDSPIAPADVAVYRLHGGRLVGLVARNERGRTVVDTSDLTDPMARIYKRYKIITD